jgi:hypothetical protein
MHRLGMFTTLFVKTPLLVRTPIDIVFTHTKCAHSAFSGIYLISLVVVSAGVALFRI